MIRQFEPDTIPEKAMTVKWSDMPETKRLKEFVEKEAKKQYDIGELADQWDFGYLNATENILAELERLEKEQK